MKNQYFGDVNDYCKYGLLRCLAGKGVLRVMMAWMLTEDDDSRDGRNLAYLTKPQQWRISDPDLFDTLSILHSTQIARSVLYAEERDFIPGAVYHSRLLTDNHSERTEFFNELSLQASTADLIFFDPDNGIEVKSVPYGRKNSSKYVYWHELQSAFTRGHSLLVYQHFPRQHRMAYLNSLHDRIREHLQPAGVTFFWSSHVAFVLISQKRHQRHFKRTTSDICTNWNNTFQVFSR